MGGEVVKDREVLWVNCGCVEGKSGRDNCVDLTVGFLMKLLVVVVVVVGLKKDGGRLRAEK